jgi:hypothetical protein
MSESFDAYWLRFVRDHQRAATQWMHVLGNLGTLMLVLLAVVSSWKWILLAPLPALIGSRISHRYIERNVPLKASENPRWFLRCELRMVRELVLGTMAREVERANVGAS